MTSINAMEKLTSKKIIINGESFGLLNTSFASANPRPSWCEETCPFFNVSGRQIKAKINVRQNLKQADINEAIRETRAKFINAASNTEEAQAFLYASETFVKQEKAKAYK